MVNGGGDELVADSGNSAVDRDESTTAALTPADTAFVVYLAILCALGQLASTIYLPSLPSISAEFRISVTEAERTYTAFLIATALGQLVYGPLADRFGRRPIMLTAMTIYVLGSLLCAVADDVWSLSLARVVQAAGAAAGVIVSRAVARDLYRGPRLVGVLALVSVAYALAPGIAPVIGGLLDESLGWRVGFVMTAAIGIVVAAATFVWLRESVGNRLAAIDPRVVLGCYVAILRHRRFMVFALASAILVASLNAFLAGAPSLAILRLGLSPSAYGVYVSLIGAAAFIVGSLAVKRVLSDRGSTVMSRGAFAIAAVGLTGLVFGSAALDVVGLIVGQAVFFFAMGLLLPMVMGQALEALSFGFGTAVAAISALQMGLSTVTTLAISLLESIWPAYACPAVMTAATTAAAYVLLLRRPAAISTSAEAAGDRAAD
jgi:DHA1 family bicyclomycin/chloramphenicol resistance-like MFS transporter